MKKFKKIIAIGCTVIMSLSMTSMSAFAKQVINYDNGMMMTIYETEEEFDKVIPRTVDMTFSTTLTTTLQYLRSQETYSYIMTLSGDETEIVVVYDNAPKGMLYTTLYDVTSETFLIDDDGPIKQNYAVSYSGLPKGHKYKLGYRTAIGTEVVSGSVNSY